MEISKPLGPEDLLFYHPDYPVLICKSCHYAIQPSGIARHLKEIHHILRSRRRPYMEYASQYNLAEPEDIFQIKISRFPVRFLPVFDGLRCLSPDSCDYLCVSTKRMQNHWLSVHGMHGSPGKDWQPADLQTFFRGNLLRYFTNQETSSPGISKSDDVVHRCAAIADNLDEMLFHHYFTSTSLTLVDRHGTENIWQNAIPQLAIGHPFLMHALLACSAMHLAQSYPAQSQTYLIRAHNHQDLAMPLFRQIITAVTQQNCHSILAFCYFLVIYSFAADRPDERLLLTDPSSQNPDCLCSWLYFVRNSCFIVCSFWDDILSGPLGPLAKSWDEPLPIEGNTTKANLAEDLLFLISQRENQTTQAISGNFITGVFRGAVNQMAGAFAAAKVLRNHGFTTWDAVRMWPMELSVAFIELLNSRDPVALGLLAHYCLLLEMIEPHWYFRGRGEKLLNSILEILDDDWRCQIQESLDKMRIFLYGGIGA